MATSKKITALPSWGGAQVATDLITGVDLSQPAATQNVKSTLTDFFGNVPAPTIVNVVSGNALIVGPNGATNPTLDVDTSVASAATGLNIIGRAAGAGVSLNVISSGANENLLVAPAGTGAMILTASGAAGFATGPNGNTNPVFRTVNNVASQATGIAITGRAAGAGVTLGVISSGSNENLLIAPLGTGGAIVTSNGSTAFSVGPNGDTNPVFRVVGNVASAATGISITGRAAGAGVSFAVISSGSNEDLSIEPAGTGDIYVGNGITNATPVSSSINATGGSGTNIAGANLNLVPGKGTGTGIPGLIGANYPLTTASGTTLQSLSTNFFPFGSQQFLHNNGDITVSNTTETSVMGAADYGSKDFEAGLARTGRTFFIRLLGGMSVQAATTPTLQVRLKLGSTTIADTTAVTIVSGASTANGGFTIEATVSLRTVGASASVAVHSLTVEYTTSNGTTLNRFAQANVASVDLTATQTWDVTVQWVGASTHSVTIFSSEIYMDR